MLKIEPDNDGYIGRECPKCEKYFKIKYGTGLSNTKDLHCPYCNHIGSHDNFWTREQIEYARSVARNKISSAILSTLKKMERKPDKNAFISIGIRVKGTPDAIVYYSEKELEEKITCDKCTLEYTIYGAFGYCPDCGCQNTLQIANSSFDLALKMLELATKESSEIKAKLIENALEDAISTFDGFGRVHYKQIAFQNILKARDKLLGEYGFDLASGLTETQWQFVTEQFQKRHLIAHKMGIIDEEFILKTGKAEYITGRKIHIREKDTKLLIDYLRIIMENLFKRKK